MSLSPLEIQQRAGLHTGKLAHRVQRGFRPVARSSRVHHKAKRNHILDALVLEQRTALLGEKREPQVPAAHVLDPCKSRNKNVLHCDVFHKWNVIAEHNSWCLPHRERPAEPPSGENDAILDYNKLNVGAAKDSDKIVTFRALPLREVAA